MLAHYETFNCTIIQQRKLVPHVFSKPWKPISDPVQCSNWAGPGTFRNGSLACNIIRNTLGYHLIFLQRDHEEICSNVRSTSVTCDSLSWWVLLSSFLLQMGMSQATSLHAWQAPAVFPRHKDYSLMDNAYALHTYYICMNGLFLACKIQFIESIEREYGTSWMMFIELCLFIYLFSSYSIGNTFICMNKVICGVSHVTAFYLNRAIVHALHGQFVNRA